MVHVYLNVPSHSKHAIGMANGFVIILAHQINTYIGTVHVSAHVSVLFFQKVKGTLLKNIVTILVQSINLHIGIILAKQHVIFLSFLFLKVFL